MIKLITVDILGQPNVILNLKEGYNKTFKNILTINVDLLRTANPHLNKYFETLSLTFWGRSLVKRRYGLYSNSNQQISQQKHGVATPVQFYISMTPLLLS